MSGGYCKKKSLEDKLRWEEWYSLVSFMIAVVIIVNEGETAMQFKLKPEHSPAPPLGTTNGGFLEEDYLKEISRGRDKVETAAPFF